MTRETSIMEGAPPDVIDTHAHIQLAEYDADRAAVLQRAQRQGVQYVICPGIDLETSKAALELARSFPCVRAAVGVHPHEARRWNEDVETALSHLAEASGVVAIGETGMDLARHPEDRDLQARAFRFQARLARSLDLPLIVHNREADTDIMEILGQEGNTAVVLHCFTSTATMARQAVERGWYLGFGGVITYRSGASLVESLPDLPADRLLVETDCPYLSPAPNRRRRNEPSGVLAPLRVLAGALSLPFDAVAALTTANAQRLFPRLVHAPIDTGR